MRWARQAVVLVYVFVSAVVILLVVTRIAARRDAARKAERARAETEVDSGDGRN